MKPLRIFVRQALTGTSQREIKVVQGAAEVLQNFKANGFNLEFLTDLKEYNKDAVESAFEKNTGLEFTPQVFRNHRLSLLNQSDAMIIIRTRLSESTVFELAHNIFNGKNVPIFIAIWDKAPLKSALLRELHDLANVTYYTFKNPQDLVKPLQTFFDDVILQKSLKTTKDAHLIFKDGKIFHGKTFTSSDEDRIAEVVFNTAMCGYQEVLTDPSYYGQMVVMTYPLIGNYGINSQDVESKKIYLEAILVKEYTTHPSNWRSEKSLKQYLEENNILGVEGFDTRAITRYLREKGAMKALLTTSTESLTVLVDRLKKSGDIVGKNLVTDVTCAASFRWHEKQFGNNKVAVIDCGIKYNMLRMFEKKSCDFTVFPASVSPDTILTGGFDGVFLSNGPGDPEPVKEVIATVKQLLGKIPIFGICLGHQILGLALGAKIIKLRYGHHGVNHPIMNLSTNRVEITSQNHNYSIDPNSINKEQVEITHINLNDQTIAGIQHKKLPAFSVQYHPESSPGPHDSRYLFHYFIKMMDKEKKAVAHS
jgi:carbamoyl-phosphate synthase small subunit